MKNKTVLKYVISVFALFLCLVILPLTVGAEAPYTDGQQYSSNDGAMIWVDDESGEAFIVNDNVWREATYDSSFDFTNSALKIRNAMYDRQDSITLILGFKKGLMDMNEYSERSFYYLDEILNEYLVEAVYSDDGNPYGGDYLRQTARITRTHYPQELSTSKTDTVYCFVKITYYFSYVTTKEQEQQVYDFVELWNYYYIEDNSIIQNAATQKEKEYYIVKTIYNFITKNTEYDSDIYYDVNHEEYSTTSARYLASHSAYGAIFGNLDGAYEENFDPTQFSVNRIHTDTQGLRRVPTRNQGKAVCEGYSLLFYYMCKYNGIDCKIVTGDYDREASGKGSDPHAWNMVYLQDSVETAPEWYSIDTTFASQRTQKLNDIYTVVDYDYFLRGTENESFSPENHQKAYSDYADLELSEDDFRFEVSNVYSSDPTSDKITIVAIISRMKTDNPDEKYIVGGDYVYENYTIIDTNGNLYKIDKDDENNLFVSDGFTYYSTGYYYTCEFIDFAKGIEYTSQGKYLLDTGDYSFDLTTVLTNEIYEMNFRIDPLPMGDLLKNYDLSSTTINDTELSELDIQSNSLKITSEFTGRKFVFDESNVEIVDSGGAVLNSVNDDFDVYLGIPNGNNFTVKTVDKPGLYYIRFQYKGNYSGYINIPLEITKADLSRYPQNASLRFGQSVTSQETLALGRTDLNDYVVLTKGVDYEITDVTEYNNLGDEGTYIIRALDGSEYLKSGTYVACNYTVTMARDLTGLFDNYKLSNQEYTGEEIKPALPNFTLSGKSYQLVEGRDYTATYSNNVEVGTATMTISFIGNYTGTGTATFNIVNPGTSGGSYVPHLGWNKIDGYWYYVSKITTTNGKTDVSLLTGWLEDGGYWYYLLPGSGRMTTGWASISSRWYYFNSEGHRQTGWQKISGKWYYFNSNGVMQTGWQKLSKKWYYFNSSGAMLTGWQKLSKKWYYFNSSGAMLTGWQKLSKKWYYFNSGGAMLTGWQKLGGKWYYFNSGGDMRTGWLKSGGKWYYFNSSGVMVTSNTKIGGKTYKFNSSGVCLNP